MEGKHRADQRMQRGLSVRVVRRSMSQLATTSPRRVCRVLPKITRIGDEYSSVLHEPRQRKRVKDVFSDARNEESDASEAPLPPLSDPPPFRSQQFMKENLQLLLLFYFAAIHGYFTWIIVRHIFGQKQRNNLCGSDTKELRRESWHDRLPPF